MTHPMIRNTAAAAIVESRAFRDAMSRVAAAVHVVTTDGPAGLGGATVTAVASVSDDPPTVLVCLNRGSKANALIKANRVFCLSTLAETARPLAEVFAGRTGLHGVDRFQEGRWSPIATGSPALEGARVALDCRLAEVTEAGTHTIFLGEVAAVRIGEAEPALVYMDRHFRGLA